MIWKWQKYGAGITVSKGELTDLVARKGKEAQECLAHEISYAIGDDHYRKYRRGKNRCKRCGLKLELILSEVRGC